MLHYTDLKEKEIKPSSFAFSLLKPSIFKVRSAYAFFWRA
jgi:hypothetical protein